MSVLVVLPGDNRLIPQHIRLCHSVCESYSEFSTWGIRVLGAFLSCKLRDCRLLELLQGIPSHCSSTLCEPTGPEKIIVAFRLLLHCYLDGSCIT